MQDVLAALSGSLVGFVLGMVGGGGSIIAVPLLMYVVGVASPHVAIGTGAIAVSLSAAANLVNHARKGTVKWPCAASFSAAGMAGAWAAPDAAIKPMASAVSVNSSAANLASPSSSGPAWAAPTNVSKMTNQQATWRIN